MKIVLLTSDSRRHKYMAAMLARECNLELVITEKKSPLIEDTSNYGAKDAEFLKSHFQARAESEHRFFGSYSDFFQKIPHLEVAHGEINSEMVFQRVQEVSPDIVVLFGTSIIKNPLLETFKNQIINVHLGLSPYYKGSATNLYPFLFEEPECIGATIHLATEKVDEGAILHQIRPEMAEDDSLHEIGNKVIQKAGQVLPGVIKNFTEGKLHAIAQKGHGRLCRNKDITAYVLREIYENFEQGMIQRYLRKKEKRDSKKPIVTQI